MNLKDLPPQAIEAEQSVLGALLLENDAIDRAPDLKAEHFYSHENRLIFAEIIRQITASKRVDAVTVFEALQSTIDNCLGYLVSLTNNTASSVNIARYADIVIEKAIKRDLIALGCDLQDSGHSNEQTPALLDRAAARIDALSQKKTKQEPILLSDSLGNYVALLEDRMAGKIKAIQTGFADLDARLQGGLERGTLTVVAGRPAMGKTAFGLAIARNVSEWGSAGFLSMEMPLSQVNDRNIAALGKLPISWLLNPFESDSDSWTRLTHACKRAQELKLYIDDQTALNMLEIRNKARTIKRKNGLDALVIDQLSFITGGSAENRAYELGEYTRGLMALAKELKCAVVLLAQLNRECEKRPNKRPMLSDLASSGSIEQDAANVIFLYRDEVYNPDTMDKGICEVSTAKQRQGEPGTIALAYIGNQTRFEDLGRPWQRSQPENKPRRGFE